jgi:tetratricopeptide (TPR) repeat protein
MNTDKNKIAAECFKKGTEAMAKENWDYAVNMFAKAAELVPDNILYRQNLRGTECRLYKNNKSGARMATMKLMPIKAKIKKARMQEKWSELDRLAEDGLAVNPWDPQLNADMAEACAKQGYQNPAVFGYEKALAEDPDNKEYNRSLALLLEDRGEYGRAIEFWKHLQRLDPYDSEARSKVTSLEATKIIERKGYETAQTTRDVQTGYDYDRPVKKAVPDAVEGPGVSIEADLKYAIRKAPAEKENYLKLADYYRREKRLDDAADTLAQALQVSGGDTNVREILEDVDLDRMKHGAAVALAASQKDAQDQRSAAQAAALVKELLQREIEVFSSRVERYPNDSRWKLELAKRLMKVKKHDQAIPLLQRAQTDVRIEGEVLVRLGKCFLAVGNRTLAVKQFERVIPKLNAHDRPDLFAEAHYILGRLYEEAGDREKAEHHYNEVLAVDYGYKDARQRFDNLQKGAGGDKKDFEDE